MRVSLDGAMARAILIHRMCGIAGWRTDRAYGGVGIHRILELIKHRGPDDSGNFTYAGWEVGVTRLAIQDPERGRQPMTSSDGRWSMVFNGEIYNFRHIRDRLVARGWWLRTGTDTEVLLESIAADGVVATLGTIEGMFAFAAVDRMTGDLWLARDRFGEKPLYVDRRAGSFAFCSELYPLMVEARARKAISWKGLISTFRYGYPWPGTTAIEGIHEVLPAQWVRRSVQGRELSGFYWRPPDRTDEEPGSLQKCGDTLVSLLDRSVESCLVADVPLGLFLSGGIDSGAVAASAVRVRPDIRAVTIGFEDADYDERSKTRKTAAHLGIALEESVGAFGSFSPSTFSSILRHYGQPFDDTSAVPTRTVSRIARRHFKVVLSGDGGDELLGGYLSHLRAVRLSNLPDCKPFTWLALSIASGLGHRNCLGAVERALLLYGSVQGGELAHAMSGVFSDHQVLKLFAGTPGERESKDHLQQASDEARLIWKSTKDPVLALSLFQIRHSLPQDILKKVDRMSMSESLEVRSPLLNPRFAAYALSLPGCLKVHEGLGKFVLRRALASRLPPEVLRAPKRGFAMPVRRWMGDVFWKELALEVDHFKKVRANELNVGFLEDQVQRDTRRCRSANDYRAIHRSVLIYAFLRWRRTLLAAQ